MSKSIKFVKAPPDNRIRSLPSLSASGSRRSEATQVTQSSSLGHFITCPGENSKHSATSSLGYDQYAAKENQTLHITTPKKRNNHVPNWDIFIKPSSLTNVDRITKKQDILPNDSSSNYVHIGSDTGPPKNVPLRSPAQTSTRVEINENESLPQDGKQPCHNHGVSVLSTDHVTQPCDSGSKITKSVTGETSENKQNTIASAPASSSRPSKSENISVKSTNQCISESSQIFNEKWAFKDESSSFVKSEQAKLIECQNMGLSQRQSSKIHPAIKCSVINLTEVIEEEIESLPEIQVPKGGAKSADNDCANDSDRKEAEIPSKQNQLVRGQPSCNVMTDQNQTDSAPRKWTPMPKRPFPMGPLRRSISMFNFIYKHDEDGDDESDEVSFFHRVKNSKLSYQTRQSYTGSCVHTTNPYQSQEFVEKVVVTDSDYFGGSDIVLSRNDRALSESPLGDSQEDMINKSFDLQLTRNDTPVDSLEESMKHRRLSRDSLISARLAMRRFALSDPEKMIIPQELREKLEHDVQRRKASTTRKVSQFFNVQLGLNREEDLI